MSLWLPVTGSIALFLLGLAAGRFYPLVNLLWLLYSLGLAVIMLWWLRRHNRRLEIIIKKSPGLQTKAFPLSINQFDRADRNLALVQRRLEDMEDDLLNQRARQGGENLNLLLRATTDPLTGLPNREQLDSYMKKLFAGKGPPISLIMLDIDHFKKVNDTYGHDAGDKVLKQFAGIVRKAVRPSDQVFRYGGEEFTVVCKASLMEAFEIAGRVRAKVEKTPVAINDNLIVSITASFGVARHRPGDTPETLHKRADEALYIAKQNGRNRVCKEEIKE